MWDERWGGGSKGRKVGGTWATGEGVGETLNYSPMRLASQLLWSGKPWATHGDPDHGKSEKYPTPSSREARGEEG